MRALVFAGWIAAALALAPAAHGDPAPAPAESAKKEGEDPVERLLSEGKELYRQGKSGAALEKLRAAWELKRSHVTAARLGIAELDAGRMRDAAEHLDFALRAMPAGTEKRKRDAIAGYLQRARAAVGAVRLQIEPPGAECTLDGSPIGEAPLERELFVDPGSHTLVVKLDGYVPRTESLVANAGTILAVSVHLHPESPSAAGRGPLTITLPPLPEDRTAQMAIWAMTGVAALAGGLYCVAVGVDDGARRGDTEVSGTLIGLGAALMVIGAGTGIGGVLYERRAASTTVALQVLPELRLAGAGVKLIVGF